LVFFFFFFFFFLAGISSLRYRVENGFEAHLGSYPEGTAARG
jgi:hypothetical protein